MNVQIQTVHFNADSKLLEHVNAKIEKLKTFHDKIISADVYLKVDNKSHQVRDKVAEIKIYVPKHSYFVKHQSKTFEESFDLAFDSLVTQVKRKKEKSQLAYS
ncbi:MAG: HPF/RaiA family ribosome-associated protein [Bacteroidota bacterium]